MLVPITGLVSAFGKYKSGAEEKKVFDNIKKIVSQEALPAFLDYANNIMCIVMHPTRNWEHS
jgi:hypothetical protein